MLTRKQLDWCYELIDQFEDSLDRDNFIPIFDSLKNSEDVDILKEFFELCDIKVPDKIVDNAYNRTSELCDEEIEYFNSVYESAYYPIEEIYQNMFDDYKTTDYNDHLAIDLEENEYLPDSMYTKIVRILDKALAEIYGEGLIYNKFLELNDNYTLLSIPSDVDKEVYWNKVGSAFNQFENETGVELFAEGRSGRHICVNNTAYNAVNYKELKQIQEGLEQEIIDYFNKKDDDLDESLNEAKQDDGAFYNQVFWEEECVEPYKPTDKILDQTAGYILKDGSIVYVDEWHGEEGNYEKSDVEFSSTHFEEDTCVRIYKEPTKQQYNTLEKFINLFLDNFGYCKIETPEEYAIIDLYNEYGETCKDSYNYDKVYFGNYDGFDAIKIIKRDFTKNESLNEHFAITNVSSTLKSNVRKYVC